MENSKKYYIGSDGISKEISTLVTPHVINGLAKKYREIFDSTSKDEFWKKMKTIDDLKEDLYLRINKFYEKIEK